jgi:NAD(P)-dependent dehydrogenase (short-subunit alcohol dehydrogenase family)
LSIGGIRSFERSWTVDLKNRKIRVNAISPGVTETPMSAELTEQLKTILVSMVPMARMGRPDEIAKAVAFLACDYKIITCIKVVSKFTFIF